MSLPRIVLLAGTLGRGGAERQLFYQAVAWRRLGGSVRVISLAGEAWERPLREAGVEVVSLAHCRTPLTRCLAIRRDLKRRPADVLHSGHFFVNPHAIVAARLAGIMEVCAIRSTVSAELAKRSRWVGCATLKTARWMACNSMAAVREARARGIPERRLLYCPNVVDRRVFHPPRSRVAGLRPRILGAGRLVPEKRFDRFLKIVAAVRKRWDVEAVLAGDGPLRRELEHMAAGLGLRCPFFRFEAAPGDVAELYRRSTLLLQTSETEGVANVILEAMATGLPVVASRAGGTEEAVDDGVTGYLVDGEGLSGCRHRICRILGEPELGIQMGQNGLRRVVRDYSLEGLPGRLHELYGRVLADG